MTEDFNREKKNSDFGLDLLANQSKIKPQDSNVNLQDISNNAPSPTITKTNTFSNFSGQNQNIDYSFKADDDSIEINTVDDDDNKNYSFNPSNNQNESSFPHVNRNDDLDSMPDSMGGGNNYDNVVPEKSYEEIMNEKYELLYKIDSLKKRGISIPGNVTIESNIDEIKYVYNRVVKDRERLNGVKFARKMLMACCTGIEFLNNRFDPFDIKLDGWSESVHENIGDYDEVFEELHEKYKSKAQVAPEFKLLFMLGGSAFMFHLTNSMFKNTTIPGVRNIMKENPELMKQFQNAALNSMNGGNMGGQQRNGGFMNMFGGQAPSRPQNVPNQANQFFNPQPQREMKPPVGVDDIINELDLNEDADIYNLLNKDKTNANANQN